MSRPPAIALVACRVFEQEIMRHGGDAPHILSINFLEIGLHDQPDTLRESLARAISLLDARTDIEAVALAYGLCGCGTAGLRAGRHPVVIPRAHDCMTLFLGSKERFAERQAAGPDTYYFTPGWMTAGRTPGPERMESLRAELSRRFDPEDVEFLLETEREHWARHGRAVFLDLDTPGAEDFARRAQATARELGWEYERPGGDASLLKDLLTGRWDDERFQILRPGETLEHNARSSIFRARGNPILP